MVNFLCLKRAEAATADRVIEANMVDEKLRKKDHVEKTPFLVDLSHIWMEKWWVLMEKWNV